MGLLDNQTQQEYYQGGKFGDYQFVTLQHIIDGFILQYVGEGKILNKVNRTDVQFHAMRAMQELTYDVLRSFKSQEIEVPNTLIMPLPQDYINYRSLTTVGSDGVKRNLYPTGKTSNPFAIRQDSDGGYIFEDSKLSKQITSNTWENYKGNNTEQSTNATDAVDTDIDDRGRRYGLDPQHAHEYGSFFIDRTTGYIHFSSSLAGDTIVLDYISDGLGTDEEMIVHKFCEEACYKWIAYGVLSSRSNTPDSVVIRFRMDKTSETRKAKIRLSNIKIEEFTQILKGISKIIK